MDSAARRTRVLNHHLATTLFPRSELSTNPCLSYEPPELSFAGSGSDPFSVSDMRGLLDGHNVPERDWLFNLMIRSKLFNPRDLGGKVFVCPDYNQTMEQQREATMRRIEYLSERGVFDGWLTGKTVEDEFRKFALLDVITIFDHSLSIKIGVHFFLWGGAIKFFGTERHHVKWLKDTENYVVKGCFAMTELGHGSNVRGIETVTTYDSRTGEFIINTPCESAQKYWIGGAANHATHTVAFSQLIIDGVNQGVHAFIVQIRDADGNLCRNIRIADCGHKIGLNGVDNGRIWFDNVRIPRENLLNSVADVTSDGQYISTIKDPDQRFAAFLSPLTSGRVTIAIAALYSSKIGLAIAIRYALTRRAFSIAPNECEVLLLDYPSHQRRLLPLLAKTYAMTFTSNHLKHIYMNRTPESNKTIHILSSAFKATFTWHNMRTLQECREACGGQGLKTENRVGHLKGEFDVQSTFEGDNNVLMQQISKALFAEYLAAQKRKAFKGLGLEHMNKSCPAIPGHLSSSVLRSDQFQIDAFQLRERDLLKRFAEEILRRQANGESKEYAFMSSYSLAEDLGRAFSERFILQLFLEVEESLPAAGPLKDVLSLIRIMYSLVSIEEDPAFLRYGYLSTVNAASVREEVSKLCRELRPHALALVNSLGIPDAFLSPIAFDWVATNSWSPVQH